MLLYLCGYSLNKQGFWLEVGNGRFGRVRLGWMLSVELVVYVVFGFCGILVDGG